MIEILNRDSERVPRSLSGKRKRSFITKTRKSEITKKTINILLVIRKTQVLMFAGPRKSVLKLNISRKDTPPILLNIISYTPSHNKQLLIKYHSCVNISGIHPSYRICFIFHSCQTNQYVRQFLGLVEHGQMSSM